MEPGVKHSDENVYTIHIHTLPDPGGRGIPIDEFSQFIMAQGPKGVMEEIKAAGDVFVYLKERSDDGTAHDGIADQMGTTIYARLK